MNGGIDRGTAHALLDKILDGRHTGNISALISTMHVYAEAVEDRKVLSKLEVQVKNLMISKYQRRLEHGRSVKNKVIDLFTGSPVMYHGPQFKNQDMAHRIMHKLRRLERLDEYALDAADLYLTGMLDILER